MRKKQTPTATPATTAFEQGHKTKKEVICSILKRKTKEKFLSQSQKVYYDKLNSLKLDMMIIPREDNYFNRAKSNLKFLEASMFEIPCIVSGFADGKSPYQVNPEDQKYLKLVMDNSKWIEEIEKMIADKEGRRELGRKAREYVIKNYKIEDKAHLWEEAYSKILK
jgi:glycosyltransferase involved in cell wall biosynthesis